MTKGQTNVLRAIRRRTLVSRTQLVAATELDKGTVSRAVARLVRLGLVAVEAADDHYVRLAGQAATLIGVDLTLERATVAVADLDFGLRNAADSKGVDVTISRPDETLDAIADLIVQQAGAAGVNPVTLMGIAVGLPGPISRRTGAPDSPHILPHWEGVPVTDRLRNRLARRGFDGVEVVVTNDASLGALGAYTRGRALDPDNAPDDLLYVRVSTGVGAGLVLKGHLVTGADGLAGEIGHVRVDAHGPLCTRCSQRGCLEQLASEDAVLGRIRQRAREDGTPIPTSLRAAVSAADIGTVRDVKEAGWHLGMVLAGVTNLLNPAWIVLGGWLADQPAFLDSVRATTRRYALEPLVAGVDIETWSGMPEVLPWDGERPDPGSVYSPELLGALAYVIDELGDRYLLA